MFNSALSNHCLSESNRHMRSVVRLVRQSADNGGKSLDSSRGDPGRLVIKVFTDATRQGLPQHIVEVWICDHRSLSGPDEKGRP